MKKILLILLFIPLLSNCTHVHCISWTSLTFAQSGSILQASTSLTSSLMMNKARDNLNNELKTEKICPTHHSSELNQIFLKQ